MTPILSFVMSVILYPEGRPAFHRTEGEAADDVAVEDEEDDHRRDHCRHCGAVLLLPGIIQTCLVKLTGEITAQRKSPFDPWGDVATVVATLKSTLSQTLEESSQRVFGVGIAAGGMVDSDKGVIIAVNLAPAMNGLPVCDILAEHFSLPTVIDHHPRAFSSATAGSALDERSRISRQSTPERSWGAFYMDGKIYRGLAGSGGELGHTIVQIDGAACNCGKHGC